MIGETYGILPHRILGHTTGRMEAFWTDAGVRYATAQFKQEARDSADSAGTATPAEKNQLHNEQDQLAEQRDREPSPEEQLAALEGTEGDE